MIAVAESEDFNQLLTTPKHMSHTGLPVCTICKTDAECLRILSEILHNAREELLLSLMTQRDKAFLIENLLLAIFCTLHFESGLKCKEILYLI